MRALGAAVQLGCWVSVVAGEERCVSLLDNNRKWTDGETTKLYLYIMTNRWG